MNMIHTLHLQGVHLAKVFEQLVGSDERFEVPVERHMGMVVFRLKGENEMTEKLLKRLNGSGNAVLMECNFDGMQFLSIQIDNEYNYLS